MADVEEYAAFAGFVEVGEELSVGVEIGDGGVEGVGVDVAGPQVFEEQFFNGQGRAGTSKIDDHRHPGGLDLVHIPHRNAAAYQVIDAGLGGIIHDPLDIEGECRQLGKEFESLQHLLHFFRVVVMHLAGGRLQFGEVKRCSEHML